MSKDKVSFRPYHDSSLLRGGDTVNEIFPDLPFTQRDGRRRRAARCAGDLGGQGQTGLGLLGAAGPVVSGRQFGAGRGV